MGGHGAAGDSASPNAQGEEPGPFLRGAMSPQFRARAPTKSRGCFLCAYTPALLAACGRPKTRRRIRTTPRRPCRVAMSSCRVVVTWTWPREPGSGAMEAVRHGQTAVGPRKKSAADARTRHRDDTRPPESGGGWRGVIPDVISDGMGCDSRRARTMHGNAHCAGHTHLPSRVRPRSTHRRARRRARPSTAPSSTSPKPDRVPVPTLTPRTRPRPRP